MASDSSIAENTTLQTLNQEFHQTKLSLDGSRLFFVKDSHADRVPNEPSKLQTEDDISTPTQHPVVPTPNEAQIIIKDTLTSLTHHFLELNTSLSEIRHKQLALQDDISVIWDELKDHRRCTKPFTNLYQQLRHEEQMKRVDEEFERHVDSRHELRSVPVRHRSHSVAKEWDRRQLEEVMKDAAGRVEKVGPPIIELGERNMAAVGVRREDGSVAVVEMQIPQRVLSVRNVSSSSNGPS